MKNDDARLMFYPEEKQFTKEEDRNYARERLVFNVTEDILVAMETLKVSKADLAKELNKSKSYITQTLSGERNMTLGTLSDICFALEIEPIIEINAKRILTKNVPVKQKSDETRRFTMICNSESKILRPIWEQKIQDRPCANRQWKEIPIKYKEAS